MVAGSLASSLHGIPRATQAIDIVADLSEDRVQPLVDALADAFCVDAGAAREAVRDRTRFNAIHLETVFKVDVYLPVALGLRSPRRRRRPSASASSGRRGESRWRSAATPSSAAGRASRSS